MGRRWGTPQNFFLAFTDELEKQIFIYKNVEVGNKKQNDFNIYNAASKKKDKQKATDIIMLHLCNKNLEDMIYSS